MSSSNSWAEFAVLFRSPAAPCRLASGGSFAVRQLYSDDDEVLFQASRPILLNGIEDVIRRPDLADRAIFLTLAERRTWTGTATDLLRVASDLAGDGASWRNADWPRNPRLLAGRLRRAQTFLRALGIEIAFSREGRAGNRMIRISAALENPRSNTVDGVCDNRAGLGTIGARPELVVRLGRAFMSAPSASSASFAMRRLPVAMLDPLVRIGPRHDILRRGNPHQRRPTNRRHRVRES